jgi:hypothetical protein
MVFFGFHKPPWLIDRRWGNGFICLYKTRKKRASKNIICHLAPQIVTISTAMAADMGGCYDLLQQKKSSKIRATP